MSEPEQRHIVNAFTFELGKVETVAIRRRMLGHLAIVDDELGAMVARKLGMDGEADAIEPARQPIDMEASPALSMVRKAPKTLMGRKVGVLIADGSDSGLIDRLRSAVEEGGGGLEIVAPMIGGASGADGKTIAAGHALPAGPSTFFDAVVVAATGSGAETLAAHPTAVDWVRDAFAHLKIIGHVPGAAPLLERAGVVPDQGIVTLGSSKDLGAFIAAAKGPRIWNREADIEERTERKRRR